jgi:ABC-2 type transport system permease protein
VNRDHIAAIVRKDLLLVLRNRGVLVPLLITPALLLFVLPAFLVIGPQLLADASPAIEVGDAFDDLAPALEGAGTGDDGEVVWERTVLVHLVAPLYLLVPLVAATVVAADAFAGERERRTLEALLHSPTTDRELFVAKLLVAHLPATALSLGSFAGYALWANLLGARAVGGWFFPTAEWWLLVLWLAPAVSALGLGAMVIVSHRVRSLQAAHQIGSLLILPFVLIVVAQITGAMLLDLRTVALFGAAVWVAAALVVVVGVRSFDRDRVASRL